MAQISSLKIPGLGSLKRSIMASSSGNRAPGLHTPTQSFSGSPADTMTPGPAFNPVTINDKKKLKEEADIAKQRLSDLKFNIRKCWPWELRVMVWVN